MNIVFVCNENINRSKTGELLFSQVDDINVTSAALHPLRNNILSKETATKADFIICFERWMIFKIMGLTGVAKDKIINLEIVDNYQFGENELINRIKSQIAYIVPDLVRWN
ncbi:MAG: hypothetical protein GY714_09080 [Desulfobacterales bacterium]|nr:hypothetical protein [Desulfobacterales bacterium]